MEVESLWGDPQHTCNSVAAISGIWICTQEIKSEVPPGWTGGPELRRDLHRFG